MGLLKVRITADSKAGARLEQDWNEIGCRALSRLEQGLERREHREADRPWACALSSH